MSGPPPAAEAGTSADPALAALAEEVGGPLDAHTTSGELRRIAEAAVKKRTTLSRLSFGRRASAGTPSDVSMRRR